MAVKEGYQQTEIGVFPKEWTTPRLGDVLSSAQLGGNYANSTRESEWPLIKMGNLGRGNIKLHKVEYVESTTAPSERDRLRRHDVLFNTRNTLDLVGKVSIWRCELAVAYYNSNIARLEFKQHRVSSNVFMNYVLNSRGCIQSLRAIATGTTSVAAIYARDLVKLVVQLPTAAEQEAIAEALSDADALIESLEQLIAKKRLIKQGVMQELLTGKRRLPGFDGDWVPTTLGKLGATFGGLTGKSKQHFGHGIAHYVPFLNVVMNTVIDLENLDRVVVAQGESQNLVQQGDLLFNGSSETPEEVGLCCWVSNSRPSLYLNSFCFGFRLFDTTGVSGQFMAYFIRGPVGRDLMKSLAQGSTRYNLSKKALLELEFSLPVVDEQRMIARVLDDMDCELDALGQRLRKAHMLKQGMMQQLLTGRIRLR